MNAEYIQNVSSMEHRWSPRKALTMSIRVHRRGKPPVEYKSGDISIEGIRLFTSRDTFDINESLEVEFALIHLGRRKQFCLPGLVVHTSESGVGIMFVKQDVMLCGIIGNMLYADIEPDRYEQATAG